MDNLIFWNYLPKEQQSLLQETDYLYKIINQNHRNSFQDYSFLVFPLAKAYEGYLKQIFAHKKFISHLNYISDHFQLGKLLSPHMQERLGEKSIYLKITENFGESLAQELWNTWNKYRNKIFHYYPHNHEAISFDEAELAKFQILKVMGDLYLKLLTNWKK